MTQVMQFRFDFFISTLALSTSITALSACTTSVPDDASTASSNYTAVRAPLAAPTWVKCWVDKDTSSSDPFFQAHFVRCRYDAPSADQPIKPQGMILEIHDARGNGASADLFAHQGDDVLVMRASSDRFPLSVSLHVWSSDLDTLGLERAGVLDGRVSIAGVEAASRETPLKIKQPFDLWPVTVVEKSSFYALGVQRYPVSIAPFHFGQAVDAPTESFAFPTAIGQELGATVTHYFIAPKAGGLALNYEADETPHGGVAARIEAPGTYVAEKDGLRQAVEADMEDERPTSPAHGATSSSQGTASGETPQDDTPPRDPSCGTVGHACCPGASPCAAGSTCTLQVGVGFKCEPCGQPGQRCCGADRTCASGARCPFGRNVCPLLL